jgi:iron complex transport system substrate-binding protein
MKILLSITAAFAVMGGSHAAAMDCAEGKRAYEHALGTSCIPENPQRIVSVRGEAMTAPLLELGANIVGSSGRIDKTVNGGKPYVRGAYHALGFRFETSDVAWVGNPNKYDFEAIAKAQPDLILMLNTGAENYEKLSLIAPTVAFDNWGKDFITRYRDVADVAGELEEFERRKAVWDVWLDEAKQVVNAKFDDPSKITIGVIEPRKNGTIRGFQSYDSLTHVINELGFSMPAAIAEHSKPRLDISAELVDQFQADFMISTYWPATGTTVSVTYDRWEKALPIWRDVLHAAKHNQYFMVQREHQRPVTFQALRSSLELVVSQVATRDFVPLGVN